MNTIFFPNTAAVVCILAFATACNYATRKLRPLLRRFATLGLGMTVSIGIYLLRRVGIIQFSPAYLFVLLTFCWTTAVWFLAFVIELTCLPRPKRFGLLYLLPPPIAGAAIALPWPGGVIAFTVATTAALFVVTLRCLILWVRFTNDVRAQRDGQWLILVFFSFSVGLVVSAMHYLSGMFWLLGIWYMVIHVALHYMGIYHQPGSLETQLILDNVFDAVIILDADGQIIKVNRRCAQLSGYSELRAISAGIELLVADPGLMAETRREWLERNAYREGTGSQARPQSIDAFISTKSGEEIPVDLRIIALVDLSKRVSGYVLSAHDTRIMRQLMKEITDREYAARDLALSENKFSRMFIFNPSGIVIIDRDTMQITDVNPAMEEILERDAKALLGKSLVDVGLEMERSAYESFVDKILMEGSIPEFAVSFRNQDNAVRHCRMSAVSFDLDESRRILVSVADVTEQERLREALERKQKVETIGILAGGIAHDFNNILAVILGHIGLAKMRETDQHVRAPIEKAEEACLRAREMTRQLLAFSRGGKPVIDICDTRALLTDSAQVAVTGTSAACLFDIDSGIWPLKADRIQFGQVITNLVGNAVDAMQKGGIIEVRARNRDLRRANAGQRPLDLDGKPMPSGAYVEIHVKDQGPGIPAAIRARIFDPFFTTKEKGTGLGLAIVFSVVQNHGGSIRLEPPGDEGADFCLFVPADPDAATARAEGAGDSAIRAGQRALLMDDDPSVLETAGTMLSTIGFEVVPASDGAEAVRLYTEAYEAGVPFALAVLDLVVPGGMSGKDTARAIRDYDPGAILLVSSGYSDDPVLARFEEYGFDAVLPKPYTVDELKRVLIGLLA